VTALINAPIGKKPAIVLVVLYIPDCC